MLLFPNCKINLGLRILRKRTDGYHDLETIFYPLPLCDVLEVTNFHGTSRSSTIPFSVTGIKFEGDGSNNLCIKAYKLLKKKFPELPLVQMDLHKVIPAGAGLGGGSSDGAYTLILLNKKFNLGLKDEQLQEYAAELGSDCPFFIINKPCYATGRGEILEPINLDLSALTFVLVNPGIHVNTGQAFLSIKPYSSRENIKEIIQRPIERWKDELVNDFEQYIFRQHREIVDIKDQLYVAGALFASMSGSGSTVYGIFKADQKPDLHFPSDYFVKQLTS